MLTPSSVNLVNCPNWAIWAVYVSGRIQQFIPHITAAGGKKGWNPPTTAAGGKKSWGSGESADDVDVVMWAS